MDNAGDHSHSTMDEEIIQNNAINYTKNTNHIMTPKGKIFANWQHDPVSLGPENQLSTYQWPPPRATDLWGYWENKIGEWK
jgi:hypothetical protein